MEYILVFTMHISVTCATKCSWKLKYPFMAVVMYNSEAVHVSLRKALYVPISEKNIDIPTF